MTVKAQPSDLASSFICLLPLSIPLLLAPCSTFQPDFISNELVSSSRGISIATNDTSTKLDTQFFAKPEEVVVFCPHTCRRPACLPDPHKTTFAKEEVGSTLLLFSESPFEEGDVSSARLNRLMWEAVIFGCL